MIVRMILQKIIILLTVLVYGRSAFISDCDLIGVSRKVVLASDSSGYVAANFRSSIARSMNSRGAAYFTFLLLFGCDCKNRPALVFEIEEEQFSWISRTLIKSRGVSVTHRRATQGYALKRAMMPPSPNNTQGYALKRAMMPLT